MMPSSIVCASEAAEQTSAKVIARASNLMWTTPR
jgi:hypothetical protein